MLDSDGKFVGGTLGPAEQLGGSVTHADTGAWSLSETIGKLIEKWDPLNFNNKCKVK